jgi:enoyl-CoA hydratase
MRYDGQKIKLSHMSFSYIEFETAQDGIATLTVNRPQKLNALNAATMDELDKAFAEVQQAPTVRGMILTGAGEKAFVAGADINELATSTPAEAQQKSLRAQRILRRLELMSKPSIAAINGFALGGGLELAMACTLRVAATNAKLGQPEVKLGIIAGYGGTQRLPRLVGRGKALELLLTGDPIDAAEAQRIGLVNHVVPREELLTFSRALLARMLVNGPVALRLTLEAVDAGLNCGLEEGLRFEAAAFGVAVSTSDRREGTTAFLEKRSPVFTGN